LSDLPIQIEFSYSADDYAEGARGAGRFYGAKNLRKRWLLAIFSLIASLAGGPWIILANQSNRFALLLGSAIFGVGILYLLALFAYFWRVWFGLRQAFPRIEVFQGTREMSFDDKGHKTRGPRYFSELSLETYRGFAETKNLFLLFQPPGLFVMVPKRAFTTDQLAEFRNLLLAKITTSEQPVAQPRAFFNRKFLIVLGIAIAITVLLVLLLALHFASQ